MYNFTRKDIDLEAIRTRIAGMSDRELLKYGQSAAWMAGHNDRATWRVQLEEAQGRVAPPAWGAEVIQIAGLDGGRGMRRASPKGILYT
jgi:hypothetical protein